MYQLNKTKNRVFQKPANDCLQSLQIFELLELSAQEQDIRGQCLISLRDLSCPNLRVWEKKLLKRKAHAMLRRYRVMRARRQGAFQNYMDDLPNKSQKTK